MKLIELAAEYRSSARRLEARIALLNAERAATPDSTTQDQLTRRIRALRIMLYETREIADLLEHYYETGGTHHGQH